MKPRTFNQDLAALRDRVHPGCVVCSPRTARLGCSKHLEGYRHALYGGAICTLLDAAVTNCLFARGKTAATGKLTVRFQFPVMVDRIAIVRAWSGRPNRRCTQWSPS